MTPRDSGHTADAAPVPVCCQQAVCGVCLQVKKQGPLKLFLFNLALRYKQFWMKLGYNTTAASPLCNKVFFSKTQVCVCGWWPQGEGRVWMVAVSFDLQQSLTQCDSCRWLCQDNSEGDSSSRIWVRSHVC